MITIITATCNNYEELVATLSSVPSQEGQESIVINGGSCERTRDLLKSHPGQSISEPDQGIADAFNKGLRLAKGEAVMFLNSGDVLIDPEYPARALVALRTHPEVDFVHADEVFGDELIGDFVMKPLRSGAEKSPSIGRGMPYRHQTMVVRKRVYDEIGGFNLRYKTSMDYDWVCRWEKSGGTAMYLSGPPVVRMDGRGVSAVQEWRVLRESTEIIMRHFPGRVDVYLALGQRWLLFLGRQVLRRFGLTGLLAALKRRKRLHAHNGSECVA